MRDVLANAFSEASHLLSELCKDDKFFDRLSELGKKIVQSLQANAPILIAGNGGSMADAMHFAEEWTGRFRESRRPYPVMALSDPTYLTCVANDFGYEEVFARGVEAFARQEGLVVLLTTSGNSKNLIHAAKAAESIGCFCAALTGKGGGELSKVVSLAIDFPGETSDRVQELQMLALHALIEAAEGELGRT